MSDAIEGVNQADFLKLFMQELTYQDPLKPIDNREFMAQMAQFSALKEAQSASNSLLEIANLANGNQNLALLGKTIKVKGNEVEGTVNKIEFPPKAAPIIHVLFSDGQRSTVALTDITSVS
ncbi:MAG: flagellar hook capping protein [Tatlockia sp.]|nr:flagellar hook capping protein [Tatlockia sp.]